MTPLNISKDLRIENKLILAYHSGKIPNSDQNSTDNAIISIYTCPFT